MSHTSIMLRELNLSSNSLNRNFCEAFSELLKSNRSLKQIDLSCNYINEQNNASLSTLKDALKGNPRIVALDLRNNSINFDTEEEIKDIITRNKLEAQGIPYSKLAECKSDFL